MERFDIFVRGLTPPIFFWIVYAVCTWNKLLWDPGLARCLNACGDKDKLGAVLVGVAGSLVIATGYVLHQLSAFIFFGSIASIFRSPCFEENSRLKSWLRRLLYAKPIRYDPYVRMLKAVVKEKGGDVAHLRDKHVEGALAVSQSKDEVLVAWMRRKWSIVMNNNDFCVAAVLLILLMILYYIINPCSVYVLLLNIFGLFVITVVFRSESQRQRQTIFEAHRAYLRRKKVLIEGASVSITTEKDEDDLRHR